jgi:CHC2 zinc finger/Toprim domain
MAGAQPWFAGQGDVMIEAAILDEIRARVLVSEIVGRRVKLRKAGREWKGLSPFNKERTPSFYVNDQKMFWHDFSSGKHGDVFGFLMEAEGRTFPEAVEEIAALAGVSLPETYRSATRTVRPETAEAPSATARFEATEEEYAREVAERLRLARQLWTRSVPGEASIVETYLRARGYHGPIPATIRYLPRNGARPPALIAAYGIAIEPEPGVLAIADDAVVGVHLIKLKPDGSDRLREDGAKITIGKGIVVPIMLAPPNDGLGMVIAEGIEDALIAHQETGLGALAAGGATKLPTLADAIPNYIECVTILVDDNEAGRVNSNELAARINQLRFGRTEVLMTSIGNST